MVSGRFWGKSSASRSGDALGWFWVCVSIWILYQMQGVLSAVFGFRCFFALLFLPPFLLLLLLFWWPAWVGLPSLLLRVLALAGFRTSGTSTGRSPCQHMSFSFSFSLPGSVAVPPLFLPPSALSLSLSFSSLSVLHALLRGTGGNNRYVTSFAVLGCTRDTFS